MTAAKDKVAPTHLVETGPQTHVTRMIDQALVNPDISVEKMRGLFEFQKEVMAEQAKMDFAAAMSQFQASKAVIKYNKVGTGAGESTYGYADFPQMVKTVSPWMAEAGLSFTHRQDAPVVDAGKIVLVVVYCVITHAGGHSQEFSFPAVPDRRTETKWSPSQLLQASITYAKRQTLAMGLGLATGDDKFDDDAITHLTPVSEEQAANLRALMEETASDEAKFLKWIKAETVEAIPEQAYEQCVKALEAKRRK